LKSRLIEYDKYIAVIPSNKNAEYIFDKNMRNSLINYNWHVERKGYLSTNDPKTKKQLFAHHLVVGKPLSGMETDHKNRNKRDNRKGNLRHVSHARNRINANLTKKSKSGFKGVSWYSPTNKWRARIGFERKKITIGYFDCPKKAAEAYDKKALELFGDFACTNYKLGLIGGGYDE
jgi:hypothetical protein